MSYSSFTVASDVIQLSYYLKSNITNLKLNKILFFIQESSKLTLHYDLIGEDFEAWRHGPVLRDVYYYFKAYLNFPIRNKDSIVERYSNKNNYSKEEWNIIFYVTKSFLPKDDWELVKMTQSRVCWINHYSSNQCNKIPNKEVGEYPL